jgi:predicted permease
VALSLVLLIGAGLLIKSFVRLSHVEPGFRAEGLYTLRASLGGSGNAAPERQAAFFRSLVQRAGALPGVRGAAVVNHLPIAGDLWRGEFLSSTPPADAASLPKVAMRVVSPGYFRAMGVPLRGGRDFEERDGADAPPVVIVNEALARLYWPGRSPVGERLRDAGADPDAPWLTVVGVAADVRQESLSAPALPEVYYPYGQNPFGWFADASLVVRHDRAWAGPRAVAEQVWSLDRSVPVYDGRSMTELLAAQLRWRRVQAVLLCLFAATALALATVGLYGVVSYLVAQRTREIGVRMALGASRPEVVRLVLREGLLLAAGGTALGLAAAWLLSRFLAAVLYGVRPADPAVYAATAALVAGFALLASWLPARRATRVDPMIALRAD